MFLTFTYFTFYGMMAIGLTPTQHLASVISSAFYSLWNLLAGFLVPKPVSTILSFLSFKLKLILLKPSITCFDSPLLKSICLHNLGTLYFKMRLMS